MKSGTLRKSLAIGAIVVLAGYAAQASAVPVFTFTQYGGFEEDQATGLGGVDYSNPVVGAASLIPPVTTYSDMAWVSGVDPQSSMNIVTQTGPNALTANTWTTLSTLTHNNIVIPQAFSFDEQDITSRFIITDGDGGANIVLDDLDTVTFDFLETANDGICEDGNPVGTNCDDLFTFTISSFADVSFTANDGSEWNAEFRLANFVNSAQIDDTVYTGENQSSTLDVEVRVTQVPEPASIALMGLGLLGLGFAHRRKLGRK